MSDCEATREGVQAYLDGELEPAEQARLEGHLSGCPSCQRLVARYRRLFTVLEEPAIPQAPSNLVGAVMRRVAAERARSEKWQRWVAAAAVALVVAGATFLAWGQMASAEWLAPSDLSLTGAGQALAEFLEEVGELRVEWSGEWLPTVSGAPALVVVALVLLGANAALAYRWRGLARLNGNVRMETIR